MSFLSKLLRKPIIKNGYSFLGYDHVYSMETVKKSLFKRDFYEPLSPTIQSITLSKHAWERWNERIGPPISFQDLSNLVNQLVLIKRRITAISDRRGLIDSDILFIYQQKGNSIHITTFYGRLSHHPALRNIRDLKAYQLLENERIILALPSHLLNQQQLPVIPIDYIEFEGRTISYVIQKYRVSINNSERILLFLTETSKFGHIRMLTIDPHNFFETVLNHSVLYVMFLMGYRDFVMEHLQFYKPDAILKAMQRYDAYLKRRLEETEQVLANIDEKK